MKHNDPTARAQEPSAEIVEAVKAAIYAAKWDSAGRLDWNMDRGALAAIAAYEVARPSWREITPAMLRAGVKAYGAQSWDIKFSDTIQASDGEIAGFVTAIFLAMAEAAR